MIGAIFDTGVDPGDACHVLAAASYSQPMCHFADSVQVARACRLPQMANPRHVLLKGPLHGCICIYICLDCQHLLLYRFWMLLMGLEVEM